MLKILDWYIIKKYLSTFFFVVLIFSLVTIVIDFSEKIDNFLEESAPTNEIIWDYYTTFIPFIHGLLFPVYALLSVIFFTSRMAYNSEVISMLAGGISFRRLLLPYFVGSAIIASLYLLLGHVIIPYGNKTKVEFENKYIFKYDGETKRDNIHFYLTPTTKIYIRHYSITDTIARDIILEEIVDGELKSKLTAKRAKYSGAKDNWKFTSYDIRTFDGMKETYQTGVDLDTMINLTPNDIERRNNLSTTMTTPELVKFLKSEKKRGTGKAILFQTELYNRTAAPISIIILTFIGMIISARKVRGGTGLHLAIGAGLGAVYILFNQISGALANSSSMHPMLSVWLPNIIFVVITILLLRTAQK